MPHSWGKDSGVFLTLIAIFVHFSAANSGLLSSTLTTFNEMSCDGETMKMSCPPGLLVSIQFAQYGRQVPSSRMCPSNVQNDDPGIGRRGRTRAVLEDTNCMATTSLKVILDACQDRQSCSLVASTKTFEQDPCPGTRKYLEVAYKCRPNEFSSETVCEGDQLELRCSRSTRIVISTGMFGRATVGDLKCPELLRNTSAIQTTCRSKTAVSELKQICHGRKSCTIYAEEYVFGNPCPKGVNKYLNVVYTCVPKQVLKSNRKNKKKEGGKNEGGSVTEHGNHIPPALIESSSSNNKAGPHTTTSQRIDDVFPADAATNENNDVQRHPSDRYPGEPVIGKSKDTHGGKHGGKFDDGLSRGSNLEPGKTTPCMNKTESRSPNGPSAVGLLTDWINTFNFMKATTTASPQAHAAANDTVVLPVWSIYVLACSLFIVVIAIVTLIVCRWKKKRQKRVVKPLPTGEGSRRLRNELNNGTATQQTFEYFLAVPSTGVRILKQNNVEPHSRPLSESDRDSALLVSESSKFSHDRRVKDVNSINTHKAKENMFRSDVEKQGIERLVVALTQVQKENELEENTEPDNKKMQRKIKKKSIATKLGHMQKSADPTAHDHKHSPNLKHVSSTSNDENESDIDSSFKSEQHDLYSDVSGMTADISGNDCSTSDDNSSTLSKSSREFIRANVRRFQRQNLREHLFNELAETEQNVELLKVSRRNIPSGAELIQTIQQTSIHQCVNVDDEILPKRDGPLASSSFKCEYRKANSDMKVKEVTKNDNSKHKQDQGNSDDVILDNGEELNITPRKANLNRSFSLTEMDSFNRQNQNVQPNRRKRKYQSLRQPRRHTVDVFGSMFNPNAMPVKGILKTTIPDSYEIIPACHLEHQKPDVQIANNTLSPTLNAPGRYSNKDHEDTSSDEKIDCSESPFEDTSGQVDNTKNSLPGESKLGKSNLNETLTFSSKEECIQSSIVDLTDNISNSYKVDILSSNLAESKNITYKTKENNVCLKHNVCARDTAEHIQRNTPIELANDDTNMHERALEQRRNTEVKLLNKLNNADSIFKVKGNTTKLNEDCDNKDNIDCLVLELENITQSIAPNEHKLKCLDIQFDEDQAHSSSFANVNTTEHDTCSQKNLKSNTLNSHGTTHVYKTLYGTKTNTVNKSIASPSHFPETEIKPTLDGTETNIEHQSNVSPSCCLQTEITHTQGRFKADTPPSTDATESKRIISAPTPGGKLGSFNYPRLCAQDDMYIAPTHVKEEYCSNNPTYKTAEPSRNLPRPKSSLGLRMSKPESVGTNYSYHVTAKSGASTLKPVSPTQSTITPKVNVRYDNRWFVERTQPVASDKSSNTVLSLTSKLTTGIIKEPRTWEESTTSATEIVNDFKQIHNNEGDNVKKCYTLYERSPRPLKEPKENTIAEPFQFNDTKESTAEKLPKKVKSGKLAGRHLNQLQQLKDPSAGATLRSKTPTPHTAEFKQSFPQLRSKTPTPNIRHFEDKTSEYQTSEYQTPVTERGNDTESAQKNRHILFENRSKSFSVKDKQIETTRLKLNPLQPRTFANGGQRSILDKPRSKTPTPSTNLADRQPVRPRSKTPTPRTEYLDDRMHFEPAKAVFKQKENFRNGNTKHRPQIELFSSNMVKHGTNKPFVVSTYSSRPSLPSASSFQQRSKTPTVSSLYTSTDNFTEKQLLTRRSRTPNKLTETMASKTIPERPKSAMSVRRLTSEKTKCSRENEQETLVHLSNLPLQASELIPYPGGNNSTNQMPIYPILGNSRPSNSSFRNLMEPWVSKVDASSAMWVKKSSIRNKNGSKNGKEQSTNVLSDGVVDIDEFLAGDDSEIEGVFKIPDENIKSLKTEEEYTVTFIDDYERAYKTFKNRTTLTKSKSFKT